MEATVYDLGRVRFATSEVFSEGLDRLVGWCDPPESFLHVGKSGRMIIVDYDKVLEGKEGKYQVTGSITKSGKGFKLVSAVPSPDCIELRKTEKHGVGFFINGELGKLWENGRILPLLFVPHNYWHPDKIWARVRHKMKFYPDIKMTHEELSTMRLTFKKLCDESMSAYKREINKQIQNEYKKN